MTTPYPVLGQRMNTSTQDDLGGLVESVVDAMERRSPDVGLRWRDADTVRVIVATMLPAAGPPAQLTTRRRRFKRLLCEALLRRGWLPLGQNRYQAQGPRA